MSAHVLMVSGPRDESYDMPALFGPFDSIAEAQAFAEDFREANRLPREATPENNDEWSGDGWYFGIHEATKDISDWGY